MRITYVILHYLTFLETKECIESILNTEKLDVDLSIVVVDNASTNDSYDKLSKLFKKNKDIHFIKNSINLGFAKGNNQGFQYAKHYLKSDFIVCLNNDVIVSQKNINDLILKKYAEHEYAVLGPDILTKDGYHQNPLKKSSWTIKELRLFRLKRYIKIVLSLFYIDKLYKDFWETKKIDYSNRTIVGDIVGVGLHGAFLIFSPLFINKYNGLNPKTFLYMEEDLLKLQSDFFSDKMIYTSDIQILHKEDASSDAINVSNRKKNIKKARILLHSSKVYMNEKRKLDTRRRIISFLEKVAFKIKKSEYKIDLAIPTGYLIQVSIKRFLMLLKGVTFSFFRLKRKSSFFLGRRVKLKFTSGLVIEKSVTLNDNVEIDALSTSGVILRENSSVGKGTIIRCSGSMKEIGRGFYLGKNSSLADNCFIGASGGVAIGDNVIGGQNIRFHASNHVYDRLEVPIKNQGISKKGIKIGNNCWIGAGAVFLDGVTIGEGCVIGANAVVTKCFPNNCIIGGIPAKIIAVRK